MLELTSDQLVPREVAGNLILMAANGEHQVQVSPEEGVRVPW
jgi:hypothetical protein